jgi:hypothetical protein
LPQKYDNIAIDIPLELGSSEKLDLSEQDPQPSSTDNRRQRSTQNQQQPENPRWQEVRFESRYL